MNSITELVKQSTQITGTHSIPAHLAEPGRLLFEVEKNRSAIILDLEAAIARTAIRMGVRVQDETQMAVDFITYVQMNYKSAYAMDLLRTLDLASVGDIEKTGQLTQLSVLNLTNWFKIYWNEHRSKYLQKPELKQLPEMSNETKIAEVRKSLETWLNQTPSERVLMSAWFYQKFWEWGIMTEANLTKEARRNAYNERLTKYATPTSFKDDKANVHILSSLPGPILNNPEKRKTAQQMIDQCTDESGKFKPPTSYVPFAKNDLHLLVMEECRNEMLNHFIFKQGNESILRQFDQFHA